MPGAFSPVGETQVGAIAYLFGVLNNGTPIAMTGIPSFELDSDEVTLTWDEKKNKDTSGYTQNITQTDFRYERSIKFNPSGATRAAAASNADAVFALGVLVVANFKDVAFNGTYRIMPGTKLSLKAGENADMNIACEKYVNASQNAALTGAAIVG